MPSNRHKLLVPVDAENPFDSAAKADVILRSSDGIDYHVLKAFLSFSSSVFEGMFSLERPVDLKLRDVTKNSLPVVPVEESGETLRTLLFLCYPGDRPKIAIADYFLLVDAAASKYCMVSLRGTIEQMLLASPLLTEDPLKTFAIAIQHRWEAVARLSALRSLALSIHAQPDVDELNYISGFEFHQLLKYHAHCRRVAQDVLSSRSWLPVGRSLRTFVWCNRGSDHLAACLRSTVYTSGTVTGSWWERYTSRILERLGEYPNSTVLKESGPLTEAEASYIECSGCRSRASRDMKIFIELCGAEIDRAVSKASWATLSKYYVTVLIYVLKVVLNMNFASSRPTDSRG